MTNISLSRRKPLATLGRRLLVWWERVIADKAEFQQDYGQQGPDLEDILSEQPPRRLRNTHYVVVVMFLSLVVIASLVSVDMIVAAPGRLVTDQPTIVVQPMHLAIVREIRVKPGDVVHKGDVLATLDPTFTQADKLTLTTQQNALRAQIQRLEAETSDTPLVYDGHSADELLQLTLYNQRRSQYASRLLAFDEDIQRFNATSLATEQNRASLAQQTNVAKEVEGMRAKLFSVQAGSKLNYLDSQVVRMRTERDYQDTANHLTELRHQLLTRQAERQVFVDEWRRQLLEDLVKSRAEASAVADNLVKATRMNDLVVLKAPEDGIVLEIGKRSVGSVVQDAEQLVTMVPTGAALIAEVMINSADVGYTKLGDDVVVKVDAFPYQHHGFLSGRLRSIGEDSTSPNGVMPTSGAPGQSSGGIFHRSRIELMNTALHGVPEGTHLIPGMTLTAEIKVGTRSIISYFLYPILRGLNESIREP